MAMLSLSAFPLSTTLPLSKETATSSETSGKYRNTVQFYVLGSLVYHTALKDDSVHTRCIEIRTCTCVIKQKIMQALKFHN